MNQLIEYPTTRQPLTLFSYAWKYSVSAAVKTLLSLASTSSTSVINVEQWGLINPLYYLLKLWTRSMVGVLRVMMDYLPRSFLPSPHYFLSGGGFNTLGASSSASSPSMDLMVLDVFGAPPSSQAVDRALSHILTQINELPATSGKYQFAIEMAENMLEDNLRDGHEALLEINRADLSTAFLRTTDLLHQSLRRMHAEKTDSLASRFLYSLPLGSYLRLSAKGFRFLTNLLQLANTDATGNGDQGEDYESVNAEKFAQELIWITKKLKYCGAIDEALMHWSISSGLASLSLAANPRVQSAIVLISAILIREAANRETEVPSEVKCRLLLLWVPLFCYARDGLTCPILTAMEKSEMEKVMEGIISTLPVSDQEIILTNWFQDFINSNSNWPNLQNSYDRWCRISRKLVT